MKDWLESFRKNLTLIKTLVKRNKKSNDDANASEESEMELVFQTILRI